MPKGTEVEKVYEAIKDKTGDKGKAARIAQAQTGEALATGKPPKHKEGTKEDCDYMMERAGFKKK